MHTRPHFAISSIPSKLISEFPEAKIQVKKSQSSFSNRNLFAWVSFLRVRKKADLPDPYIVITLGLSYLMESSRVPGKTEPYPGRWTTHIVIGSVEETVRYNQFDKSEAEEAFMNQKNMANSMYNSNIRSCNSLLYQLSKGTYIYTCKQWGHNQIRTNTATIWNRKSKWRLWYGCGLYWYWNGWKICGRVYYIWRIRKNQTGER